MMSTNMHTNPYALTPVPTVDDKGRPHVANMDSLEMLAEIVTTMRGLQDALEDFTDKVKDNPMLKMLM